MVRTHTDRLPGYRASEGLCDPAQLRTDVNHTISVSVGIFAVAGNRCCNPVVALIELQTCARSARRPRAGSEGLASELILLDLALKFDTQRGDRTGEPRSSQIRTGAQPGQHCVVADGTGSNHRTPDIIVASASLTAGACWSAAIGATRRYCCTSRLIASLMSFCAYATVSAPPKDLDTSPMRVRSL